MTETRWFTAYEQAYARRPRPYGLAPVTATDDEWLDYCETSSAAAWFAGLLLAPCTVAVVARTALQHLYPFKAPAAMAPHPTAGDLS